MARVPETRLRADVPEDPGPVVLKQHIAPANGGDVQVCVPVIVDIGKRSGHADVLLDTDPGPLRDVLEFAATLILPEFVAAGLSHEVDVVPPVSIDVGNGESISMVVMGENKGPSRIVDDPVAEGDAGFMDPIRKGKVM